jgi:hypothetical protein
MRLPAVSESLALLCGSVVRFSALLVLRLEPEASPAFPPN